MSPVLEMIDCADAASLIDTAVDAAALTTAAALAASVIDTAVPADALTMAAALAASVIESDKARVIRAIG